ncbi:MAG: hypothetical protein UR28_C0045G0002 [Candidatus Peregrinibacteria bacterium GW2011_GWF2_33_10]|nr:MAG: hypothetical protein UR28_C0045G0002 [Candidatus Peregrinibacteria bacterium GW2011_GWF2_33_10]OGJ45086.1 MAG: hypothetical protein A2263_02690 [Candidatus Peregrinibacteria bacterium RIFOXYA2_FULL_33_21]OGJ45492.1 MAG: hypothetical protein A2272_01760 [Candidatus Peregrinibacteria bacterium RIFOXYA12_FULL_33_12]OGJ50751.1 MAG: hypothetical protein A2307_05945 [Candidatus Peregrinibacteria bacterium RIFOXYB2_FULL_33_20]
MISKDFILVFVSILFEIIKFAIVARIILSWFRISISSGLSQLLADVTDPVLNLAKKITPRIGMFDFSPVVALIGLDIIKYFFLYLLGH